VIGVAVGSQEWDRIRLSRDQRQLEAVAMEELVSLQRMTNLAKKDADPSEGIKSVKA
jgi:hypothetical protein